MIDVTLMTLDSDGNPKAEIATIPLPQVPAFGDVIVLGHPMYDENENPNFDAESFAWAIMEFEPTRFYYYRQGGQDVVQVTVFVEPE